MSAPDLLEPYPKQCWKRALISLLHFIPGVRKTAYQFRWNSGPYVPYFSSVLLLCWCKLSGLFLGSPFQLISGVALGPTLEVQHPRWFCMSVPQGPLFVVAVDGQAPHCLVAWSSSAALSNSLRHASGVGCKDPGELTELAMSRKQCPLFLLMSILVG